MENKLTADRRRGVEDAGDFRVHVDHHVFVCLQLLVTFVNARLHPSCEVTFRQRVDHVCDVGSGQLPRQKVRLHTKEKAILTRLLTGFRGGQPAGTS